MASRTVSRSLAALLGLAILLAGFASVAASSAGLSAQPRVLNPREIVTRTMMTFATNVSASSARTATLVGAGGDWVAYTLSYYACGHCGFVPTRIGLRNDYDRTDKVIQGAVDSTQGDPVSIDQVQFVMPYLVWRQPARPAPGEAANFTKGDFDCTLCYYNVTTGQGGQLVDLAGLGMQTASLLTASPLALDRQGSGRVLMWVHADLPGGGKAPGQIWIVDIKSGEKSALLSGEQQAAISEMAFSGDLAAWLQDATESGQDIFVYKQGDGAPRKVSSPGKLTLLKTNGTSLFAWKHDEAKEFASGGVVVQIDPGTEVTKPILNTTSSYDVYGTRLAGFHEEQPGLRDLTTGAIISGEPVIPYDFDAANFKMVPWLDHDQFTFSALTTDIHGTILAHSIGQAWLLPPNSVFQSVLFARDRPGVRGDTARAWLWGMRGHYYGWERYDEAPGGRRLVQYFDKTRMEINNPNSDENAPYYVTNGLLAVEMIGGQISLGDQTQITATVPSTIPVAGDPRKDNPLTPGYSALRGVASLHGENQAQRRIGLYVVEAIDINGFISLERDNSRLSKYVAYVPETGHNIPDVFMSYLQDLKGAYGYDWTYAFGYPITEAYWTRMKVQYMEYPVMIQAYQRRVLTYIPGFAKPWDVQPGNVGQHYFEWRYTQNSAVAP